MPLQGVAFRHVREERRSGPSRLLTKNEGLAPAVIQECIAIDETPHYGYCEFAQATEVMSIAPAIFASEKHGTSKRFG